MTRRHLKALTALLLILLAAAPSRAAPLKILAFEDASCKTWLQSKDDPELRLQYIAWARGFLSGHNYANQSRQVTDVSSGTIELYITRYCKDKPAGQFIDAAYRMSDEYSGRGAPITR